MRILWVKVGGLWPANAGGRLRSFHMLAELSRRHQVTVVTTRPPDEEPGLQAAQLPHCTRVYTLPHAPPKHGSHAFIRALLSSWSTPLPVDLYKNRVDGMARLVARLLEREEYDVCIADFLAALPNLPVHVNVPVVVFSHNVEYRIWQRLCDTETSLFRRLLLAVEWRKLRRYEIEACRRAALTIAVSDTDRDHLQALAPLARIDSVPTGVDINYFSPAGIDEEQRLELVFSGSMDWFPNEDAMLWFIDAVLPLLRMVAPDLTLTIVGRNPSNMLRQLAAMHNVTVTGTVDDVRPHVRRASVYIVPLRIGGGTRLKIFEGLAMGKAIVSTTIGAEGLPLEDGKHIVLADTPETFAREVLALLHDPAARARLGRAGRLLMETRYSWRAATSVFEHLCHNATETINPHPLLLQKGSDS